MAPSSYDIRITNENTGAIFYFRGCSSVKPKKEQPVLPVALISTTAENTLLFRFFGQQEKCNFTFTLFNDGTNMCNSGSATTIQEQILYIKNTLFTDEFDTLWNLYFPLAYGGSTIRGVLTGLEFDIVGGQAVSIVTGTISFQRGRLSPFT